MARGRDGGPPWVVPLKAALESFFLGERLKLLKQSRDELKDPKADGLTKGEAVTHQTFTIGGDS
jgi:hypothetical protein